MAEDQDPRPARRWLRPIEGLPTDPKTRVAGFLAATESDPADHTAAALLQVVIHSGAALRCRRAVLDAFADREDPDRTTRAAGDGSLAAVALWLAASAAQHASDQMGNPGPLGRPRLDALVSTAEHLRDCVIHWDEKAREKGSDSFLSVTDYDILVLGSARKDRRATMAGLTWKRFESDVDRLRRWAEFHLDARLAAREAQAPGKDQGI